jgi:hypothetical protein
MDAVVAEVHMQAVSVELEREQVERKAGADSSLFIFCYGLL